MYAVVDKSTDQVVLVSAVRKDVVAKVRQITGVNHGIGTAFDVWSEAQRNKAGIYSVTISAPARFEIETDRTATYDPAADKVTVTITTANDSLADINAALRAEVNAQRQAVERQGFVHTVDTTDYIIETKVADPRNDYDNLHGVYTFAVTNSAMPTGWPGHWLDRLNRECPVVTWQDMKALGEAALAHKLATFGISQTHKAAIQALVDAGDFAGLQAYDLSTLWPPAP